MSLVSDAYDAGAEEGYLRGLHGMPLYEGDSDLTKKQLRKKYPKRPNWKNGGRPLGFLEVESPKHGG